MQEIQQLARECPCDHGRVLCGDCSSLSRLQRGREAAERYRHTERGRRMACLRQRRCRALKTRIVTHGWSIAVAPEVTLPVPTRMCVVLEVSDEKTAGDVTLEREQCEALRYRSYYSIDINDLSLYHLTLNSQHWGVEALGSIVDTAIEQVKRESPEL